MLRKHFTHPDLSTKAARLSVRYRHATHLDSQQVLELCMVFQMSFCNGVNTYPAILEVPCLDACKNLICFFVDMPHWWFRVILKLNKYNQLLPWNEELWTYSEFLDPPYTNVCTILRHPVLQITYTCIVTPSFSVLAEPMCQLCYLQVVDFGV